MPGFRPERLVVHPEWEAFYRSLEAKAKARKDPEAAMWKGLQTALTRIRIDGQWGEVVDVPKYFHQRYGAVNLYCIDLAKFHRCFYTIEGRRVVFLGIVDHRQYDKWFPNRGR